MTAIQTQVDKLSQSLGSSIDDLLGKLQKQTGSMAAQTDEISKQMQNLNSTLDNSLKDFTTSSAKYVRKTLGDFDEGLADMSETDGQDSRGNPRCGGCAALGISPVFR